MADAFQLQGSYAVKPLSSPLSFAPSILADINESRTLKAKQVADMSLASDAAAAVDFGGVANANIVVLKAVGGKVAAAITSADGVAQVIPFDSYLILMSESVPITAITLTRVAGTVTTVRVFLGEKA